jgi:hypothetical protein
MQLVNLLSIGSNKGLRRKNIKLWSTKNFLIVNRGNLKFKRRKQLVKYIIVRK